MVPKQFKFSRNKNKNNLWLRVLHFRLKECEHSALGVFEVKFCFSFIYSKILIQFKTLFIFFLQQKKQGSQSNIQTRHVSKTKIMKLPLVIWRFEGLASNFWRRGEVGSSDATNLGQKPKMASFGRLWQPVNSIGECEMS